MDDQLPGSFEDSEGRCEPTERNELCCLLDEGRECDQPAGNDYVSMVGSDLIRSLAFQKDEGVGHDRMCDFHADLLHRRKLEIRQPESYGPRYADVETDMEEDTRDEEVSLASSRIQEGLRSELESLKFENEENLIEIRRFNELIISLKDDKAKLQLDFCFMEEVEQKLRSDKA